MALTDKLTAIADAIRAKTGKSDSLTLDQMPTEIANITGGGGSSADVRYVTFTNPATGETYVKPVAVGDDCVDVVAKGLLATPTKESTAKYNYAFANSWSATPNGSADANILKNITEDKTVYAVFTATLRYYTITWLDEDGTTLKTESKAYGTVPSYKPTKEGYTFSEWQPQIVTVTGDASYTAVWLNLWDFNATDWSKIAEIAATGEADKYFALGAEKRLTGGYASGVAKIVGFNHDNRADGTGKAGITLMLIGYWGSPVALLATGSNSTAYGYNWTDSSVYKTNIPNNAANQLGSALNSILKSVSKDFYNYKTEAIETVNTKFFFPSRSELDSSCSLNEGATYELFQGGAASRIAMLSNTAKRYWTRSKTGLTKYMYIVDTDGNIVTTDQGDQYKAGSNSTVGHYAYAFVCI